MRGKELTADERDLLSRELGFDQSLRSIARRMGRDPSVIAREVSRNGGRFEYRAMRAQARADAGRSRPKQPRLEADPRLHDEVASRLATSHSPRQVSERMKVDFPDDVMMHISHEAIHQALYLQARGELNTQLSLALRQGRTRRVPRARGVETRGKIRDMTLIAERPPEAGDRAVPGFWEGDLILGAGGRSQIATLVERATRFTMLVRVPYDRTADRVAILLALKMKTLPAFLARSITWDQGKEMAEHAKFSAKTGIDVFFADPHSPWQRGTNENTNGLLRQYFPKGTDLSAHGDAHLDAVAAELNERPRQTLGWATPAEKLAELLAAADAPTT